MFSEFISTLVSVLAVFVPGGMIFLTFFLREKYRFYRGTHAMKILTLAVSLLTVGVTLVAFLWIVSNWVMPAEFEIPVGVALIIAWAIAAFSGREFASD